MLAALVPVAANAQIASAVAGFFAGIILAIASFLGKLTLTLIGLLIEVAQYNDFINAEAVKKGWVIVRDISNMFFVVILLLIAFGSVFRIEEYQYKKLLGKLLIMAVLVNFSKAITGFFIDVAQVVMLTFVNGFKEAAAGNFVQGFHLAEIFKFAEQGTSEASGESFLFAAMLALITIIITTVVVAVYLMVFLIRIVALWFLVIVSPIAYVLSAFPGDAKKYSSMWWDQFGRYASTGPILAFFLWLSLAVMQFSTNALGDFTANQAAGVDDLSIPAAAITEIGQSEVLLSFIVNIILLMGGLWMTQQLGVMGGQLAGKAMAKIQGAGASIAKAPLRLAGGAAVLAGKGAKGTGKFLWEEATSRLGVEGSLKKWKEGWQKGVAKRASDRVTRQQSVYLDRVEKGRVLQALGSPAHLFTHQWNLKNLGKVASFRAGDITGKTYLRHKQRADEIRQQMAALSGKAKPNKSDVIFQKMEREKKDIARLEKEYGKKVELAGATDDTKAKTKLMKEADEIQKAVEKKKQQYAASFSQYEGKSPAEVERMERERLVGLAMSKRQQAKAISDNKGLLPDQMETRNKRLEELTQKLVSLQQAREAKARQLRIQGLLPKQQQEALAGDDKEIRRVEALIGGLQHPGLSAEEKSDKAARVTKLRHEADEAEADAKSSYTSEVDRAAAAGRIAKLNEEMQEELRQANEYAPATDYEIRREQRTEINKEMSEMQTDNWQELHKIMRDAIEVGDTTRAAAAYLKATKYGNENEIQNEFGFKSDATGMRQFIEEIFIKKLGMAREQALSIGSDASYIAEGVKHWGAARAVKVENGKMEWQDEGDRMKEVLAEVRKVDFERFLREANRLAWGSETPAPDLPPDVSAEERAKAYAVSGQRGFQINDFGKAYFVEKWEGMREQLKKERFNVNLAVNLTSGDNVQQLEELARKGFVSPDKLKEYGEFLDELKEFAGTGEGEGAFANIENIMKGRSV